MLNPFKRALLERGIVYGGWLALSSPLAAEALAHAGFDFLVLDTEHAPADTMDAVAMLQAMSAAPAHAVLRVTENAPPLVKRAMDAGAQTLLFPNVNSATDAALAAAAMRYPQDGNGGLRGVAAVTRGGRFGLRESRIEIVVVALSSVRGPASQAQLLYEETSSSSARRQAQEQARRDAPEPTRQLRGRPTKRDGRALRRVTST